MPAADGGVRHDQLLQYFNYDHDNPNTQMLEVNRKFAELAQYLMQLPSNAERTTALRKLLEAKDCATRAGASG